MQVVEFEIEEHVAEHNRFFKQTAFTLDDLDAYAEPLGSAARAVYDLSEGFITEEQVIATIRQAVSQLKALHAAMELENAA
jgi:hypothetical protein